MSLLKAALGFVTTGYMNDVVLKPRATGKLARSYCDRRGKPLLLIRGERMVDVVMGDPVKAEVVQRRAYPLPFPDKAFGAVMAVNVLERLKRPDLAIREWRRVAEKVFVCVPSWWAPHAWFDPGHRWVVHPDIKKVMPLWTKRRSIYLLPVSDRRYGAGPWSQTTPPRRRSPQSSPSPSRPSHETSTPFPTSSGDDVSHLFAQNSESPFAPPPESQTVPWSDESDSDPFRPPDLSRTDDPSRTGDPSPQLPSPDPSSSGLDPYDPKSPSLPEMSDLDEVMSSAPRPSHLGSPPSRSSSLPKVLTVVSTQESDGF